jgi:DNA gyrase/topoisomerase IV subunit A
MQPSDYILTTSHGFSVYACESRAIPKVTDGLKDSQRKMLWIMRNKSDKLKTISLAGECISSNLYLHGDQSASDTISMMAAPFCNNVPLFDGIGSFGTRTAPTGWGAARYTYVKRGKAAQHLVYPDLDIIPLKENYDGSAMEPIHFLPIIPLVLLNGISGIAVGYSTDILSRSLQDLIDACISVLDNKVPASLRPAYTYLNCSVAPIGLNVWEFSGKVAIIDTSTIRVYELPPELTLEKFKERLNEFEDKGHINSYTDRSTKAIDITIKFPRGSIRDWTDEQAVDFLKLKQKKTERIVVIDWSNDRIRQYPSAEQLVADFVNWRLKWYTTRYESKLKSASYELQFWRGIKLCFEKDMPSRLLARINKKEVEADVFDLTKSLALDEKQVERIAALPTYRWSREGLELAEVTIDELQRNTAEYNLILSDEKAIRSIYKKELMALKKVKLAT